MFNCKRSRAITRATAGSAATFCTKSHKVGCASGAMPAMVPQRVKVRL